MLVIKIRLSGIFLPEYDNEHRSANLRDKSIVRFKEWFSGARVSGGWRRFHFIWLVGATWRFMGAFTIEGLIERLERLQACGPIPSDVKRGEVLGILCPRGQSRRTLVTILTTILFPVPAFAEASSLAILGNLGDVRRDMGIIFQESTLDQALTGRENLEFHARLYGLDDRTRERRISEAIELFGLTGAVDTVVGACPPTMMKRLEIARAFLSHPGLLLLAEPTGGLDEPGAREIRSLLRQLNRERGVTIVFTTHSMADTEEICDRVAVVDGGEVVALDAPETFCAIMAADDALALELDDIL